MNDGSLAHRIGQRPKSSLQTRNGCGIDDGTTTTALHGRNRVGGSCCNGPDEQCLRIVPALQIKLFSGLARAATACVVEQNIQATEMAFCGFNRDFEFVDFCNIALHKMNLTVKLLMQLKASARISVNGHDLCAFGDQAFNHVQAYAGSCSGDGCHFIFKTLSRHVMASINFRGELQYSVIQCGGRK